MKNIPIFRFLAVLPLLALMMGSGTITEPKAEIYPLDGIEAPVYYVAEKPLSEGDTRELAVIMIHGWYGGVAILKEQYTLMTTFEDAYIVSPLYPRTQTMESRKIEKDGRAIWNDSWPRDLTIPGSPDDDWRGGGDANGTSMSSYDIVDEILAQLSDCEKYPNLKRIALVGYSAGGQFVDRYVAVGKGVVREGITLIYAAMSPSTFFMPTSTDIWHYGISNRPRYCRETSNEQIMKNLRQRRCLYSCGALDVREGTLDKTPPAMQQGENRFARYLYHKSQVEQDPRRAEVAVFLTFDSLAHESLKTYANPFFVEYVRGTR